MLSDARGPEEQSSRLQSQCPYPSLPVAAVPEMRIADCRMRIVKESKSEIPNPKSEIRMADACGASCLSFRSLARFSKNIGSTNLEMIPKIYLLVAAMQQGEMGLRLQPTTGEEI